MSNISYLRKPEREAVELIRQFNITAPPVSVIDIAKGLGLDVIGYDLGDGISGTLVIENGKGFIGYNPSHSKKRQRFTIGHELGHFRLHYSVSRLFIDKDFLVKYRSDNTYTDKEMMQEQEANAFSAALLMPQDFVLNELKKQPSLSEGEVIETLAKIFDVSIPAMTFRLNNINFNLLL